ncbi:glycosyltransferase [Oceanicoccus sagamiensis]|uniref:Glycosyl transferase family 1 n=1 Tax=Oceanicoccus sagamiensis TaxID=716816 RepID=A0A1X9N6Y4_9GAMM|nr:glycosyltransferase [Oceanicoccus sagamiensis]ARN73860.1 glycosyl transferase family 1 [Oceanicoccus sagamiensis]
MKILHFYRTYFPDSQGGLEEAIRQICLSTGPLGIENRVLTLKRKAGISTVERPEATVYRSPLHLSIKSCDMGFSILPLYKELLDWCDVVHYHFPWPFADMLELVAGGNKPYIVTYHSDIVRQKALGKLYQPLMNHFLGNAARIVATSRNYFASSPVLGEHSEKVDVIPLGINQGSYPEVDEATIDTVRQRYGENFFLFVGVFRYYKGLHVLLDALKGANYQAVIAGSGPVEEELKEQAAQLDLENVVFPGYITDQEKVALLKLSKGVVFPSYLRSEAFGMTLVEGAMMGKPLISTEVGTGTSHVNIDGETGLVTSPGSVKELREAMDFLYNNPEEADAMGENARNRYREYFTGQIIGEQYLKLYQDVVAETQAS